MLRAGVEDIPHALLSVALLNSAGDEGSEACAVDGATKTITLPGNHEVELPFGDTDIAWASLICSLGSMLFGIVSKTMQFATLTIAREGGVAGEGSGEMRASVAAALLERLRRHGYVDADALLPARVEDSADGTPSLAT